MGGRNRSLFGSCGALSAPGKVGWRGRRNVAPPGQREETVNLAVRPAGTAAAGHLRLGSHRLKGNRHSLGGGRRTPPGAGRRESTKIPLQGASWHQTNEKRRAQKPDKPRTAPVEEDAGNTGAQVRGLLSRKVQGPRDTGSGSLLMRQCGPGAGAPAEHRGVALPPGAGKRRESTCEVQNHHLELVPTPWMSGWARTPPPWYQGVNRKGGIPAPPLHNCRC